MFNRIFILFILCIYIFHDKIICQAESGSVPKQNPRPTQVTVSGNHPDAIGNKSTVIYDNTKNIDLRSFNRPIKILSRTSLTKSTNMPKL